MSKNVCAYMAAVFSCMGMAYGISKLQVYAIWGRLTQNIKDLWAQISSNGRIENV